MASKDFKKRTVAPFTGAWIEILFLERKIYVEGSRSLHGGVD